MKMETLYHFYHVDQDENKNSVRMLSMENGK